MMTDPALIDEDRLVLSTIRNQGDLDLAVPRHTLLYFYPRSGVIFGARDALTALASEAEASGWTIARLTRNVLVIEHAVPVDEASVAARTHWAQTLASVHKVEFDGWECAVNMPNEALSTRS